MRVADQFLARAINHLTRPLAFWYILSVENKTMSEPKSLQQAILYFSNPENCTQYLAVRRWPKGVTCPGCGSERVSYNADRRTWKCSTHHPKREFSVKVGTIFEDSPIPLDKWLAATWMVTNCKNGISATKWGAVSKSLSEPHGSCFTASGLPCRELRWSSWAAPAPKSKWTKPSSAARLAICISEAHGVVALMLLASMERLR